MPSALRQLLSTLQHRYSLAGGAEAEERDPSALDNLRALTAQPALPCASGPTPAPWTDSNSAQIGARFRQGKRRS